MKVSFNKASMLIASALVLVGLPGPAGAQKGPVAAACKDEIKTLCAGIEHGQGRVRKCLESKKNEVSEGCRTALESTGPGKGMGQGKGPGPGAGQGGTPQ